MVNRLDEILEILGLSFTSTGDHLVRCPFPDHEDRNPSFSVSFDKEVYHCFGCSRNGRLDCLIDDIRHSICDEPFPKQELGNILAGFNNYVQKTNTLINNEPIRDEQREDLQDTIDKFLLSRNLSHLDYDIQQPYVIFTSCNGVSYARRFDSQHPKWKLIGSEKDLFWVTDRPKNGSVVWLVEGVLDAYAVKAAGASSVAALCTNTISAEYAYNLRGLCPILLLDRDPAGFKGSLQCSAKLQDYKVPSYSMELPAEFGSDPSEAWANSPDAFSTWIQEREATVSPNEPDYLRNYFYNNRIKTCPTPFERLNRLLGGGFKPGLHVLTGEPKIGKTSLISYLSVWLAQQHDKKILVNTLEVPKMQMWARNASQLPNAPEWAAIEQDPSILTPEQRELLNRLADNLRIVAGWSTDRLLLEADSGEVDVLIIDYIQRLPENMGSDDDRIRASLGNTAGLLSNYSRDKELITIAVSSIPRSAYGTGEARPKGSGDIEFVCQSLSHLSLVNQTYFNWEVIYNTRGEGGIIQFNVDLSRGIFIER